MLLHPARAIGVQGTATPKCRNLWRSGPLAAANGRVGAGHQASAVSAVIKKWKFPSPTDSVRVRNIAAASS